MHIQTRGLMIGFVVGFAACAGAQDVGRGTFKMPDGKDVGTVTVTRAGANLNFALKLNGLSPGTHAIHIHAVGKCDPPDFASAGPHLNPANKKHGSKNPEGPHAGDLPNLEISKDGKLDTTISASGVAPSGNGGLLDGDGASLVIHAGPDDYATDPSGNSGGRIACAVIDLPQKQ